MSTSFVLVAGFTKHPTKAYTEYSIHVAGKQTVTRRFREFWQLREDILQVVEDAPELPSKFRKTAPSSRLPLLNAFLSEVVETLAPKPPQALLRFLNVTSQEFESARDASITKVSQWKVEIGTPKVPVEFEKEISRVITQVLAIAEAKDGEDGWRTVGSQPPFTWMARAEDPINGITANRVAFGELKRCPPRLVHDLMLSKEACMQMEPKIDKIVDVTQLDEHTCIQFFIMKSIMFMPPRDVILVRHWRVLPDQTIVHAEFSLDEYAGVPAPGTNNRVRAKMSCGGLVIKPNANDPTSCKLWRVNNMDPRLGDAIPAYALAKLNEFSASMLSNNMFSLAKLVTKADLQKYLSEGPVVNWNGKATKPLGNVVPNAVELNRIDTRRVVELEWKSFALGIVIGMILMYLWLSIMV